MIVCTIRFKEKVEEDYAYFGIAILTEKKEGNLIKDFSILAVSKVKAPVYRGLKTKKIYF